MVRRAILEESILILSFLVVENDMHCLVCLLRRYNMIFLMHMWDRLLWLCVFEAACFKWCFPLEPKPFPGLTVHSVAVVANLI